MAGCAGPRPLFKILYINPDGNAITPSSFFFSFKNANPASFVPAVTTATLPRNDNPAIRIEKNTLVKVELIVIVKDVNVFLFGWPTRSNVAKTEIALFTFEWFSV